MFSILTHLAAFVAGSCIGIVVFALVYTAGTSDDEETHEHNHDWGRK